ADTRDLDLDDVARAEEQLRRLAGTHAAGRPGDHDVARQQLAQRRQVVDQRGYAEDHLTDLGLLHDPAVDPCRQLRVLDAGQFVARGQPRTERAGLGEVLARRDLGGVSL